MTSRSSAGLFPALLLALVILALVLALQPPAVEVKAQGTGWLTGWRYRKSHQIVGSTAGAVTDYQVNITVYYGSGTDDRWKVYLNGKCRTDFGDIRFTADDGVTLLPYWIETKVDGQYAVFWVKVPSIPASPGAATIYIYYGKSDATTTSNGDATFLFFDDFDDNVLDTSKWYKFEQYGVTYSEVNGQARFSGTSTTSTGWYALSMLISRKAFAPPFIVRVTKVSITGSGTGYAADLMMYNSNQSLLTRSTFIAYYEIYDSTISPRYARYKDVVGTNTMITGISSAELTTARTWEVVFDGSQTKWYIDRSLVTTDSCPWSLAYVAIKGRSRVSGDSVTAIFDTLFVRRYVSPEPSHGAWGPEEPLSPPAPTSPAAGCRLDAGKSVVFSWSWNYTQVAYQLQIATDQGFSNVVYDTGKVSSSSTSCTATLPSSVGLYYWRVRCWNPDDAVSAWSSATTIIVDRLKVASLSFSPSTVVKAGSQINVSLSLIYEYDGQRVTSGNFSLGGVPLSYSNGAFTATIVQPNEGFTRYEVSGADGLYGLTAVNYDDKYVDVATWLEPSQPYGYYIDVTSWTVVDLGDLVAQNHVFPDLRDVKVSGAGTINGTKITMLGRLWLGGNPSYSMPSPQAPPSPLPPTSVKKLSVNDLVAYRAFYRVTVYDELGRPSSQQVTLKHPAGDAVFSNRTHVVYDVKPTFMTFYVTQNVYRKYVITFERGDVYVYLPPQGAIVQLYSFAFNDYANAIKEGSIVKACSVSGGEKRYAVSSDYISPAARSAAFWLTYGQQYALVVETKGVEYEVAVITADDQTTKVLYIYPQRYEEWMKFVYRYLQYNVYRDGDYVVVDYSDSSNRTIKVDVRIVEFPSMKTAYTTTMTGSSWTVRYIGNASRAYSVELKIHHELFVGGSPVTVRRTLEALGVAVNVPNPLALPPPLATGAPLFDNILLVIALVAIAGAFGSAHASVGLVLVLLLTGLFVWFGWLDITWSALGVLLAFAIIYVIGRARRW